MSEPQWEIQMEELLVGMKVAVWVVEMAQWVAQIDLEHRRENQWEYCLAGMRMGLMKEWRWEKELERK